MKALVNLSKILESDLADLDRIITKHYRNTRTELIQKVVKNLIFSGGKRIRPILTLALSKLFNYYDKNVINAAAAIELIHTATLLHDDVVDEANMRRNRRTAKNIWGDKTSILVGDFLLSAAFNSAISTNSMEVLTILSRATLVIAEGEVKQLINVSNIELEYDDYIDVISAKTAKLFEAACEISAILAGQDINLWAKFGHSFGMAFQIVDDVIDYNSNTGKDYGNDFYNGKVTLPIILAYKHANYMEKQFWRESIITKNHHNLDKAIDQLEKYDALNRSLELASKYTDICIDIIEKMPHSEIKSSLHDLVKISICRSLS